MKSQFPVLHMRRDLGHLLNARGLIKIGAEIGVFKGEFAEQILRTWRGEKLLLIDPWRHLPDYLDSWNLSDEEMEENFEQTRRRLVEFGNRVDFMRMLSREAAPIVDDGSLDFIYIDANHSYAAVRRDLDVWYPKLRLGGLMSGHDYFDARADKDLEPIFGNSSASLSKGELTSYGVKSAVDEFVKKHNLELQLTSEQFPTWFFSKTSGY